MDRIENHPILGESKQPKRDSNQLFLMKMQSETYHLQLSVPRTQQLTLWQ